MKKKTEVAAVGSTESPVCVTVSGTVETFLCGTETERLLCPLALSSEEHRTGTESARLLARSVIFFSDPGFLLQIRGG